MNICFNIKSKLHISTLAEILKTHVSFQDINYFLQQNIQNT